MGLSAVIDRADDALGNLLERTVLAHHRRRLRRVGALHALDAPAAGWAGGGAPPRKGNSFELLVDGEDALPQIAAAIESALSHVWLAGWHFAHDLRVDDDGTRLRDLLAETATRAEVRVLAWAGAPLPLFHPDRAEVRAAREALTSGTRIAYALDDRERPLHCHHEKLVVVDGRIAFVGGIDLTTLAGDRFDTSDHPRRGGVGWHDAAARIAGPAVSDVARHFALRWEEVTGERLATQPEPEAAGELELQVARTVPERIYSGVADGDFGILESYLRALRAAERLVYLENQFLWSPEIVGVLAEKLRDPPADGFRLVLLLPERPNNGRDDTRGQLGVLARADAGAGRLLACTLHQTGAGGDSVYVHAKVGIVDDRWLTLGSANLNEHSLFNDTEVNLVTQEPALARPARLRLWSEHLGCDPVELDGDPAEIVDERWRPLAKEQLERRQRREPLTHRLLLLPGVSRRAAGVRGPLNGFLVDG